MANCRVPQLQVPPLHTRGAAATRRVLAAVMFVAPCCQSLLLQAFYFLALRASINVQSALMALVYHRQGPHPPFFFNVGAAWGVFIFSFCFLAFLIFSLTFRSPVHKSAMDTIFSIC